MRSITELRSVPRSHDKHGGWSSARVLLAAMVATAAAVLLGSLVATPASAASQTVELEGRLSVAVSDTPTGEKRQYFLRKGLRLYELKLDPRQRRGLEPEQRIEVRGTRAHGVIDVDDVDAGAVAAAGITGSRSVMVLRVFWAQQDTVTKADAVNQVAVVDDEFYRENSYNQLGLTASATQWLQIPVPTSCDDIGAINNTAQAAATAAGYDTGPFQHNMIYISSADCVGRNWGEIGGRITWIQGTMNTYRTSHELGHNLGLGHAHSKSCTDPAGNPVPTGSTCTSDEYGDLWNVMGYVPPGYTENSPLHLSAPQKDAMGWLGSGRSLTTSTGTHTLVPFEEQSSGLHAIRLNTPGATYWLEYRQPLGVDAPLSSFPGMTDGVIVHQTEPTTGSWLLDMRPGSGAGFGDAALSVGSTWTDPSGSVKVTVDAAAGGSATVTLAAGRCKAIKAEIAANQAEIAALQEELQTAPPGMKPWIVRQIRALIARNRALQTEAQSLGCP